MCLWLNECMQVRVSQRVVLGRWMFTSSAMRARYQLTTDTGRKEAAVISLLWENKRLIDFVMLSSSLSEYSSWITSLLNRSHPVHTDAQCDGIGPPVSGDMSSEAMLLHKLLTNRDILGGERRQILQDVMVPSVQLEVLHLRGKRKMQEQEGMDKDDCLHTICCTP